MQWAGERHTKHSSYSYGDIDNTGIGGSNSIAADDYDDDDDENNDHKDYEDVIGNNIGINNIGNENKHKLHHNYFKSLRSNYIYDDDLVASFKSDLKSDLKFNIKCGSRPNLRAGCGNTTLGGSDSRNFGRGGWCYSYRSGSYRVSKFLAP